MPAVPQDAEMAHLLRQLAEKEHAIAVQRGEADKASVLAAGKLAAMVRRDMRHAPCSARRATRSNAPSVPPGQSLAADRAYRCDGIAPRRPHLRRMDARARAAPSHAAGGAA